MNSFFIALVKTLDANLYNYYIDNFDTYRFNRTPKRILMDYLINWLGKFGINNRSLSIAKLGDLSHYLEPLDKLYKNLEDQPSKDLLVLIFAFRILGFRKVKLPLSNPDFVKSIKAIDKIKLNDDPILIDAGFINFTLHKYNLKKIGFPIELYFTALGLWHDFIALQYEYHQNNKEIKVRKGDVVFDCGACWGDTALYFSNAVDDTGRVFSFEFVSSNIKIFKRNVSLNTELSKRITLIDRPLWSTAEVPMYVVDQGPGSKISFDRLKDSVVVKTQTIDAVVRDLEINKIDFIKMDIEGAELDALQGAMNSIQKFRPTLAIAVYHRISDFHTISSWIKELNLGYRMYLGHYSIHAEETILFAEVDK